MGDTGKTIDCPVCKTGNPFQSTKCIKCGTDLSGVETLPLSHEPLPQQLPSAPHKIIMEFVHGQDFGTRYRIIEEIGRGGMGRVYKAYDKELNQIIALKMICPEQSAHPEALERFKKELLLAREISNKNVVRIHDIGEADGIKYISMAYIDGLNLRNFIQASKKLSIDTAIGIIQQICNGLHAAHEKGILHRDLKTRNIMVDQKGQVFILDFGIAKSIASEDSSSLDGRIVGTPEYMSPEQAQGKPADQRSDIYSLGVIMYELLTGKVPFSGDTTSDILLQQISVTPKDPKELNPDIPQYVEKVILKCLEKNPANRYQSIQEVIDALSQAAALPKAAVSKPVLPRWLLGIAAVVIIVVCVILYFAYFRNILHPAAPVIPLAQAKKVEVAEPLAPPPLSNQWKNSIAILPFKNISAEPSQEYFCDGMTEQLISNLANLKNLKVIARTSIMLYKNSTKDIRQIAKELNVGNVLEGSVRKSGSQVRITAQLINAADGSHLWAQNYDRQLKDIFKIQDEVSQKIADSLQVAVGNQLIDAAEKSQPKNIEAYNYYLKADYYWSNKFVITRDLRDVKEAISYAEKAMQIDPEYASAYALLATLYAHLYGNDPRIEKYVKIANKLAPNNPDSRAAMTLIQHDFDKNFDLYEKLIEDYPNDWTNYYNLEMIYTNILGMYHDAIKYATRAIELNPTYFDLYGDRSTAYGSILDLENCYQDLQTCLSLQPGSTECQVSLTSYFLAKNDFKTVDKRLSEYEQQLSAEKDSLKTMPFLYLSTKGFRGVYYAKLGKRDQALAIAKEFLATPVKYNASGIYAELGMTHEAIQLLKEAVEKHKYANFYLDLLYGSCWKRVRNDPEYREFLRQQKLLYDENVRKYRIK